MLRKSFPILLAALLIATTSIQANAAADKSIALTLKVSGDVQVKKAGTEKREPLKFGTPLDDGDQIRTGEKGTVTIIFSDDKSMISLQPRTEVVISGKRDANSNVTKKVSMEVGQIFAKVSKQRGTLEIATPTSVASVKGTEFWVVVLPDGTTQVFTLEGLVELMNRLSGQHVDVGAGQEGESDGNGNLNLHDTPPGGLPGAGQGDAEPKTIEVKVVDNEGNEKTIVIQYVE